MNVSVNLKRMSANYRELIPLSAESGIIDLKATAAADARPLQPAP